MSVGEMCNIIIYEIQMHVSSCRLRGAVRRACGMTAAYNAMPLPVLRHGSTSRDRRVPSDAPPAGNANHAEANDAEHRKRRRDLSTAFRILHPAGEASSKMMHQATMESCAHPVHAEMTRPLGAAAAWRRQLTEGPCSSSTLELLQLRITQTLWANLFFFGMSTCLPEPHQQTRIGTKEVSKANAGRGDAVGRSMPSSSAGVRRRQR